MRYFWHQLRSYWSWHHLNPFNWEKSELKLFLVSFLAIMLPVYLFIGLLPAPLTNASSLPQLSIPSIGLETPVTAVTLVEHEFTVPEYIAGFYTQADHKIFIMGHSSTVFKKLDRVQVGQTFTYNGDTYLIHNTETLPKSAISMARILQAEEQDTIIIMTCAGTPLANQDATHRFIVTATKV